MLGRMKRVILLVGIVTVGIAVFTPTAHAAASPKPSAVTPNVGLYQTWSVIASTPVSHTYGVATYTGRVYLYVLLDATNGNAYCDVMYAKATLSTPTGALSANVQADLYYQPYGTTTKYTTSTGFVTASSGQTQSPSTSQQNANCGEAIGDYQWPDGSSSFATAFICS